MRVIFSILIQHRHTELLTRCGVSLVIPVLKHRIIQYVARAKCLAVKFIFLRSGKHFAKIFASCTQRNSVAYGRGCSQIGNVHPGLTYAAHPDKGGHVRS